MKKLWLILVALLGFGCEREYDLFKSETIAVSLEMTSTSVGGSGGSGSMPLLDGVLVDSIKQGYSQTYTININGGSDANNIEIVPRINSSATLDFSLNGDTLKKAVSQQIKRGANSISVRGIDIGSGLGSICITDVYEHVLEIPYELTVYYNLPPVCLVNVIPIKELSLYEVLIDLSSSYDRDARFGGAIDQYEYRIGSYYKLNTTRPMIYHIFPTAGDYEVRCRVRDNNGTWSEFVVETVTVNDI
jgi:hypothetical protein